MSAIVALVGKCDANTSHIMRAQFRWSHRVEISRRCSGEDTHTHAHTRIIPLPVHSTGTWPQPTGASVWAETGTPEGRRRG